MMNENERLIRDFIFRQGIFDDANGAPFVEPQDLQSLHYHRDTAKEFLRRSKMEDCVQERRRLLDLVQWNLDKMDRLFSKYEEGSWFRS